MNIPIGTNLGQYGPRSITIPHDRHRFILAASGAGKSSLLKKLIRADIDAGFSVVVVDPHADMVDDLARHVPKSRTNDVIWFDPMADKVIGLNPLAGGTTPHEKMRRLDHLLGILSSIYGEGSWLGQSAYLGRNAGMAIMEVEKAPTVMHLLKFFNEPHYREWLAARVKNPTVLGFFATFERWNQQQQSMATAPPTNKVDTLLGNVILRDVLGQERGLDLGRATLDRKIVLCRFSRGALGEDASELLSSIMLGEVFFAALGRESLTDRPFTAVYVDELHAAIHGGSSALQTLYSEARKYQFGITAADQFLGQLPEAAVASLLGNSATKIVGRLSRKDAEIMFKELGEPVQAPEPLQDLPVNRWWVRTLTSRGDVTQAIHIDGLRWGKPTEKDQLREIVIAKSARHWGIPRGEVETRLAAILTGR